MSTATLLLNPIAFSIGAIKVHWYGLILGLAALVGLYLAIREGKNSVFRRIFLWICCFWVFPQLLLERVFIM